MSIKELAEIKLERVPNTTDLFILQDEIELVSPFMRVAFVENNKYGQMYLKLEFSDINKNVQMHKFYTFIYTIENVFFKKICHLLNLQDCVLSSQLYKKENSKYPPLLTIKVPKNKKQKYVCAKIINSDKRTFYDIQRSEYVRVKITAKYIWNNTKKMTLRWNVSELEFRDVDKDEDDKNCEYT